MPRPIEKFDMERTVKNISFFLVFFCFAFVSSAVSAETFFCTSTHSSGIKFDRSKKEWIERSFTTDGEFVIRTTKPNDREIQFSQSSRQILAPFVMYQVGDRESFKTGCLPYGWQQLLLCDQNMTQTFFSKKYLRFEQYERFGFMLERESLGDLNLAADLVVTVGRCTKID